MFFAKVENFKKMSKIPYVGSSQVASLGYLKYYQKSSRMILGR